MNCREVEPLLSAYLDAELDLAHSLEVEAHLRQCEPCALSLRSLEEVSAAVLAARAARRSCWRDERNGARCSQGERGRRAGGPHAADGVDHPHPAVRRSQAPMHRGASAM